MPPELFACDDSYNRGDIQCEKTIDGLSSISWSFKWSYDTCVKRGANSAQKFQLIGQNQILVLFYGIPLKLYGIYNWMWLFLYKVELLF